jgi:hypothetical protein
MCPRANLDCGTTEVGLIPRNYLGNGAVGHFAGDQNFRPSSQFT